MNINKIELNFDDKSVPSLAGYDYGLSVYDNQVEPRIDYTADKIVFVFPEYKTSIASSFVEGFFDKLIKNIGLSGIRNKVTIESSNKNIKNIVAKCLE